MSDCPTSAELERYLDGRSEAADGEALEAHLNACSACQALLQEIADLDGAEPWLADASHTSGSGLTHQLDRRTLQRQKRKVLATLTAAHAPRQTTTTSRFILLDRHDGGGLSEVYVFREEPLGRQVALKVLRGDRDLLPELRSRFVREYQITSALDHPGVAPVYGVGQFDDGRDFFTMRFVGGETLAARIAAFHLQDGAQLRRDRRAFRALLVSLQTVCETIDYAHRHRVVHRDLKPKNIQVDGRETIVLDWGLAKRLDDDETPSTQSDGNLAPAETRYDERLGTPAYMSPEQAAGGGQHIDARSDIYGLGAILFEILSGLPPHQLPAPVEQDNEIEAAEAMYRQICENDTPRAGQAATKSVPAELESICACAMARDPDARYATAAQLGDEIDRWLRREPVAAHRYSPWQRAGLWVDRHRSWALAVMAALLLVAAISSIAAFLVLSARNEADRTAELARRQRVYTNASLAAEMLAAEIDLRWRILEAEAADNELHTLLNELDELPADENRQRVFGRLRRWSTKRYEDHSEATRATSWFVMDREGTLLARNPRNQSIGANGGRELPLSRLLSRPRPQPRSPGSPQRAADRRRASLGRFPQPHYRLVYGRLFGSHLAGCSGRKQAGRGVGG